MRAVLRNEVLSLFAVALLLSFGWEMLQAPAFTGLPQSWLGHATVCALAAVGDAVIVVALFTLGSVLFGGPSWVWPPSAGRYMPIVAVGIVVQIVVEWLASEKLGLWGYQPGQPTMPLTGTGLLPALYAVVVVPLSFWLVAWRQHQQRQRGIR